MNPKIWLVLAGLLGAAGVALGAFHAHGLEEWLAGQGLDSAEVAKRMLDCETGLRYQMYHALALGLVALLAFRQSTPSLCVAGICFFLGVVLFSGFLYAFVFDGNPKLARPVPFGGVLMILGWLALAWAAIRMPSAGK